MTSVRRGHVPAAEQTAAQDAMPPTLSTESASVSASMAARRERAVHAALDSVRFPLTRLVRTVAERLTMHPTSVGLATLEVEVRDALLAMGCALLTELVRLRGTGYRGHSYVCPCGVRLESKEVAPLEQRTWFGTITLERAVYAGAGCAVRAHHMPLDAEWGLLGAESPAAGAQPPVPVGLPDPDGGTLVAVAPGTGRRPSRLAPAFATVVAEYGARLPHAEAAGLLERVLGPVAHLSPTTVGTYTTAAGRARQQGRDSRSATAGGRRAAGAHGPTYARRAPGGLRPATANSAGDRARHAGHQSGWGAGAYHGRLEGGQTGRRLRPRRAAPVGAGRSGQVVPVPGAMTDTATLDSAHDFGRQLLAVAQRRGLGWARQVAVLGDGAKWIWKLAARRFPQAMPIVDWFHAQEQLWALAQRLYGEGTVAAWTWRETLAGALWAAQTADDVAVIAQATDEAWATPHKDLPTGTPRRTKARHQEVTKAVAYFTTTAQRLRYGACRAQHLPVGSGVVEGGCQSVLHTRLKRPGACWSADGAEAVARARALVCSDPTPACPHPWACLAS